MLGGAQRPALAALLHLGQRKDDKGSDNRNSAHRVHLGSFYRDKYESGKSLYGLHDMAGNVFEWTRRSSSRVIRGGSWNEDAHDSQLFDRSWRAPEHFESEIGFWCAHDVD